MGEEIHDPDTFPQKNHLLALGAGKDWQAICRRSLIMVEEINVKQGSFYCRILMIPHFPLLMNRIFPGIIEFRRILTGSNYGMVSVN